MPDEASRKTRDEASRQARDEVAEQEGQLATWDDLARSPNVVDKYFASIDKTIRFREFIRMERLLQLQTRFGMTGGRSRRNSKGFFIAILKEVLVEPAVKTKQDERLVMKSNSKVLMDIVGDVLGADDESFRALQEDLQGNS